MNNTRSLFEVEAHWCPDGPERDWDDSETRELVWARSAKEAIECVVAEWPFLESEGYEDPRLTFYVQVIREPTEGLPQAVKRGAALRRFVTDGIDTVVTEVAIPEGWCEIERWEWEQHESGPGAYVPRPPAPAP